MKYIDCPECFYKNRAMDTSLGGRCAACSAVLPIPERSEYDKGYAAGYAAAKAEMLSKLDTFNPVYVEGGRVPEDAIEHRNQPRAKE